MKLRSQSVIGLCLLSSKDCEPCNLFLILSVLAPSIRAIFYFTLPYLTLCDSLFGLDVFRFTLLPFDVGRLQFCAVKQLPTHQRRLSHQWGNIFFVSYAISLRSYLVLGGVVFLLHGPS